MEKHNRLDGLTGSKSVAQEIYYLLKPVVPFQCTLYLRRKYIARIRKTCTDTWPIDKNAGRAPSGWNGWPSGRRFAFVLTHDVETAKGQENCHQLVQTEMRLGFRSSFYFVSEGYPIKDDLRRYLVENGFEVGIHGLNHNGNLFKSKRFFLKQVPRINRYIREWESAGFRAPSMYHNLRWTHHLEIEYDSSTFDTDPFEPQPDGVRTIFPFLVENDSGDHGYVELPYTLPQDYTLFVLMQQKDISIWKKKLDWIAEHSGMALLIVHPDYMSFGQKKHIVGEYPIKYYEEFLEYVKHEYEGQYWNVLPKDIASFWKENYGNAISNASIG
jgi:hypothetical protein